jgi:type IV pilus assembly protein PilO
MTLSIKTVNRICLVVVIIVSLVGGYWAMSRAVRQQREVQRENDLFSQRLKDLNVAESNLERLKASLDAARAKLEALNKRIPESANIGEVLKQVDFLMRDRKIGLISMEPLSTVKEKLYTKIPFRLMFKGTFVNIYQLLHDLESMNRILVMEKITITRGDLTQECHVKLTAHVFER